MLLGRPARERERHAPADATIITDAGNFSSWVHRHWRLTPDNLMLGAIAGAMGFADPDAGNGDCRILTNVRCLSEGVDVPSLDAVMFLSARNSQVDVVQSVGRVMRKAPGKKYGYIIIPVVVPAPGKSGEPNREWDEYSNITQSRTVMFADGRNNVKWSAVAPADWSGLDDAIKSVAG